MMFPQVRETHAEWSCELQFAMCWTYYGVFFSVDSWKSHLLLLREICGVILCAENVIDTSFPAVPCLAEILSSFCVRNYLLCYWQFDAFPKP